MPDRGTGGVFCARRGLFGRRFCSLTSEERKRNVGGEVLADGLDDPLGLARLSNETSTDLTLIERTRWAETPIEVQTLSICVEI